MSSPPVWWRKRPTPWAWSASPGSRPRSRRAPRWPSCIWRRRALLPELEALGFGIVAFACTTCNGMSGGAGSGHPAGNHRPRPLYDRRPVGEPQLRRPHPPLRETGLPGLAAAGGRLRHRGHGAVRHRTGRAGRRPGRRGNPAQGPVAHRRRDRRHRRRICEAGTVPHRL